MNLSTAFFKKYGEKMSMTELEQYYNKFNEEKRLNSRHGQVEFRTSMKYIHEAINIITQCNDAPKSSPENSDGLIAPALSPQDIKILDIGAGTGRYSVALAEEGFDVTAVELVKYNLGILKQKNSNVKAMQGNALNLKKLADNTFDITLLFGPMYHLFGFDDKLKALLEAKRVTKPGGIILVAYCMNEYSVITYAFKERHVMECMEQGRFSNTFQTLSLPEHLYDYMRIEDIDTLNESARLTRIKIISPDGAANYIRPFLNQLTDKEFEMFIQYHMSTCERMDLIGAGAHTLDILKK